MGHLYETEKFVINEISQSPCSFEMTNPHLFFIEFTLNLLYASIVSEKLKQVQLDEKLF